jgi:DMSO/TMAO reductase YedYZ molybdopterin-dependent catalytic subunit
MMAAVIQNGRRDVVQVAGRCRPSAARNAIRFSILRASRATAPVRRKDLRIMSTTSAPIAGRPERRRHPIDPARRDRYRGLLAGALGALAMIAVFILLRPFTNNVSVIAAIADATLLAMPISLFAALLDTLGTQAKTLFLVGLVLLLVLIGAGLGMQYAAQTAGARRPIWPKAQAWAAGITAVLALFMLVVAGSQTPDVVSGFNAVRAVIAIALGAEAWAVVTALVVHLLRRRDLAVAAPADLPTIDRRRALSLAAMGAVAVGAAAVIGREVQRVATRKVVGAQSAGQLPPAITPTDDFYVVSKNFLDPSPDRGDDWSLEVGGLVDKPGKITRAELEALAGPDFVSTLTCISNEVGGDLISTAKWTGAPLATVLNRFGVRSNAVDLVAEGEDGYTDSFPIARALSPEPHIVWKMNGEPLPRLHGTPVRLIVPGLYGIKNVKWLTKLTVSGSDYKGFWQDRGWTDKGVVKTQSQIDVPRRGEGLATGRHEVGGSAFAGDRGIAKVEVSFDDGKTWHEAEIAANPSDAGLSWVIWTYQWEATSGEHTLVVRATDGEGTVQTSDSAPTLPDGASGYHKVPVVVA